MSGDGVGLPPVRCRQVESPQGRIKTAGVDPSAGGAPGFPGNGVIKRVSTKGVRSSDTGFAAFRHPFFDATLHRPKLAGYLALLIQASPGEVKWLRIGSARQKTIDLFRESFARTVFSGGPSCRRKERFDMLLRAELFSALALTIGIALIVQGCSTGSTARVTMDAQNRPAVSFAEQIAPMFEARCTECHGGTDPESGLNLSTYASAMVGSEFGTVIEAGDPEGSFIIDMIASGDMPAEGDPVLPEELELLRSWITAGAEDN